MQLLNQLIYHFSSGCILFIIEISFLWVNVNRQAENVFGNLCYKNLFTCLIYMLIWYFIFLLLLLNNQDKMINWLGRWDLTFKTNDPMKIVWTVSLNGNNLECINNFVRTFFHLDPMDKSIFFPPWCKGCFYLPSLNV